MTSLLQTGVCHYFKLERSGRNSHNWDNYRIIGNKVKCINSSGFISYCQCRSMTDLLSIPRQPDSLLANPGNFTCFFFPTKLIIYSISWIYLPFSCPVLCPLENFSSRTVPRVLEEGIPLTQTVRAPPVPTSLVLHLQQLKGRKGTDGQEKHILTRKKQHEMKDKTW